MAQARRPHPLCVDERHPVSQLIVNRLEALRVCPVHHVDAAHPAANVKLIRSNLAEGEEESSKAQSRCWDIVERMCARLALQGEGDFMKTKL